MRRINGDDDNERSHTHEHTTHSIEEMRRLFKYVSTLIWNSLCVLHTYLKLKLNVYMGCECRLFLSLPMLLNYFSDTFFFSDYSDSGLIPFELWIRMELFPYFTSQCLTKTKRRPNIQQTILIFELPLFAFQHIGAHCSAI